MTGAAGLGHPARVTPDRSRLPLAVGVLGPLSLHVDGADVVVPGVRRRALLALLALAGRRGMG